MRELRCFVFTEQELAKAVIDRRRRVHEFVPEGTVKRVVLTNEPGGGVETVLHLSDDTGNERALTLPEAEVTAALVQFCMNRKIPMPADSEKYLQVIRGVITLMIAMNFNRPPRMVAEDPLTDAKLEAEDNPRIKGRRMPRKAE
ncbi:MAG: hypothetical protein GC191_03935 [Azospirillum sp.]|nr:hypothetical protein [Azospirillum sp.]